MGMPWKYQRLIASMLRSLTAAIGTSRDEKSKSAYNPSKLVERITNAAPDAAAHGVTRNNRTAPYRNVTKNRSIEIDRTSSSSSRVAHAPANRYCAPVSTCGIQ